jgi:hypothetical protein
MNKRSKDEIRRKLQIQLALSQLAVVRRELRETLRTFEARLEIALAEVVNEFAALKTAKRFARERLDQIDNVIVLLRNRKLKPEKGRCKDLRKIEKLVRELHTATHAKIPGK